MESGNINNTTMKWGTFVSEDDLPYSYSKLSGSLGKYDGNGYYISFPPYNTTLDQFQSNLTQMKKDGYFDKSTASIEISFTIYNPKFDYYVSVVFLIE